MHHKFIIFLLYTVRNSVVKLVKLADYSVEYSLLAFLPRQVIESEYSLVVACGDNVTPITLLVSGGYNGWCNSNNDEYKLKNNLKIIYLLLSSLATFVLLF